MSRINLVRECVKVIKDILPTKEENVSILIRGDLFLLSEIFRFCGSCINQFEANTYVTLVDSQIMLGFRKTYISNTLISKYKLLTKVDVISSDKSGRPYNLYNPGDVMDLMIFLTFYKAYRLVKDGVRIDRLILPSPRHKCFIGFVLEFSKISHLFSQNINEYIKRISNVKSLRELDRVSKESKQNERR